MFPQNENRNKGTFACSPGTKTGTRAHSPKPPFYETALLFPSESLGEFSVPTVRAHYQPNSKNSFSQCVNLSVNVSIHELPINSCTRSQRDKEEGATTDDITEINSKCRCVVYP